MPTTFLLNGAPVSVGGDDPTRTLLDWLRLDRGLTGTKEGCNEGDCGACSVVVTDGRGTRALNACILFLPQLDGKAVRTVEGVAGPEGELHPVQRAMIEHHGSQCGFCTPGFITTMAAAHLRGRTDHDDQLAGNLCRCTGYAPIVRAAEAAAAEPVPDWMRDDPARALSARPAATAAAAEEAGGPTAPSSDEAAPPHATAPADWGRRAPLAETSAACGADMAAHPTWVRPRTADELAAWYLAHPDGVLVAGATDVGLWVTKGLREPSPLAFIAGIEDLRFVEVGEDEVCIGATATLEDLRPAIAPLHPDLAELIRRFGAAQVRGAATVGGNIANGSPIGDLPPALIALGATLHLRQGDTRRSIPLEDFFIDYGKQDRRPGEFVEAVSVPRQTDRLRCYKISKRFDQDISALCGCFRITVEDGGVTDARIAFGGMAGTPKRARAVEAALTGRNWSQAAVDRACSAMAEDFQPLSDMRASAGYRLETAANLLVRYFHESAGTAARLLEVQP
ncbi:xanthine dehydrogenase small subunit [Roseitranquillus sediminis]|uniref:xanthine dehydrogenase small subunit n=1 Tax=Roseitranquillus sediminis TaxID=2809051 RepID=UPI001D0C10AE|nr:xanthine dehydrogenase small subunit [Roseitranquillus sediminis]MBM9594266.1 xanthine dehydrogenase small subunit [Roseitranquillus sediminis]